MPVPNIYAIQVRRDLKAVCVLGAPPGLETPEANEFICHDCGLPCEECPVQQLRPGHRPGVSIAPLETAAGEFRDAGRWRLDVS